MTRWEQIKKEYYDGKDARAPTVARLIAEGDRMQKKLKAVESAMRDGMEVLLPP